MSYIYIYIYVYTHIHILIIHRKVRVLDGREPMFSLDAVDASKSDSMQRKVFGRGQMGSALMGSLRISCSFDRGIFWVLPLTYFYIPRSARAYLFPQSVKINYFCRGPSSVDPICPQPKGLPPGVARGHQRRRGDVPGRLPPQGALHGRQESLQI